MPILNSGGFSACVCGSFIRVGVGEKGRQSFPVVKSGGAYISWWLLKLWRSSGLGLLSRALQPKGTWKERKIEGSP